jgi:hypothetical protein
MLFRMTALVHMESIRYLVLKVAPQAILQDPQCDAEALSHIHDLAIADGEGSIMREHRGYGCLRPRYGRRRTVDLHDGILDSIDFKQAEK